MLTVKEGYVLTRLCRKVILSKPLAVFIVRGFFYERRKKVLSRVGTVGVVHWSPKPGRESGGSNPSPDAKLRSIAQLGSAFALGAKGRRFESYYSDHI